MGKAFPLVTIYVNLRPDNSATTLKTDRHFWCSPEGDLAFNGGNR